MARLLPAWRALLLLATRPAPGGATLGVDSAATEGPSAVGSRVAAALRHLERGCLGFAGVEPQELLPAFRGGSGEPDKGTGAYEAAEALLLSCRHLRSLTLDQNTGSLSNGVAGIASAPLENSSALAVVAHEGRRTSEDWDPVPWFFDDNSRGFPWLQDLVYYAVMLLFVIVFENYWLHTSLFSRSQARLTEQLHKAEAKFRAAAAAGFQAHHKVPKAVSEGDEEDEEDDTVDFSDSDVDHAEGGLLPGRAAALSAASVEEWGEAPKEEFWRRVRLAATQPEPRHQQEEAPSAEAGRPQDVIQFSHRHFTAFASSGRARVTVQREGRCAGKVSVTVRTLERAFEGYKAKAGEDFEHVEEALHFAEGQRTCSFDVPLHSAKAMWSPTRWFAVQLVGVTSGNAVLGTPLILRWEGSHANEGRFTRVYILAEDVFPYNLPDDKVQSPFYLVFYYLRERVHARGFRFVKTMAGILYDPIHNVAVVTIVQKEMIQWACRWDAHGSGCYWRIILLGVIQLLSTALYSWGDRVQHINRSRTGGTRMYHRWQLLAKMLTLEHHELCETAGSRWFYAALQNVDSMTVDAYWQCYMFCQSLLALLLSIITASVFFFTQSGGNIGSGSPLAAVLSMVLILPPTLIWIGRRRERIWDILRQRMDGEEMWTHTLSWVTHSRQGLYSFGPRERAWLEQRFAQESKLFVSKHVVARDMVNDNVWVNRWLASLSYCLALYMGAVHLLNSNRTGSNKFQNVNFVLLLKLSWDFQRYMAKMSNSIAFMQRAAVSIVRVKDLLNLHMRRRSAEEDAHLAGTASHAVAEDKIELCDVEFTRLDEHSPMGPLQMRGTTVAVPLKRLVCVAGLPESARLTFLALVAGVLHPNHGTVSRPSSGWAVMLPPLPVGTPQVTVLEALQIATMPAEIAKRFADALGFHPSDSVYQLTPGQLQELTLVRAMLRDPAVLVLAQPLALVGQAKRRQLQQLLRVWQEGGAPRIVDWLAGHPIQAGAAKLTRRTLVITAEDMEGEDGGRPDDVHLDLGAFLGTAVPRRADGADSGDELTDSSSSEANAGSPLAPLRMC